MGLTHLIFTMSSNHKQPIGWWPRAIYIINVDCIWMENSWGLISGPTHRNKKISLTTEINTSDSVILFLFS